MWLKIARLARRAGLLNLARLALERLLTNRGDHVLALRTLRDVLVEIGDGVALRQVWFRSVDQQCTLEHEQYVQQRRMQCCMCPEKYHNLHYVSSVST